MIFAESLSPPDQRIQQPVANGLTGRILLPGRMAINVGVLITPDDGGQDVFVHISAVGFGEALKDGQKVRYEVGQDRKTGKSKAENVSVI